MYIKCKTTAKNINFLQSLVLRDINLLSEINLMYFLTKNQDFHTYRQLKIIENPMLFA